MTDAFKCGDRVRLRQGGPVMAVTGTSPDRTGRPTVWCAWFDDQHRQNTAGFVVSDLEAVQIAELGSPP